MIFWLVETQFNLASSSIAKLAIELASHFFVANISAASLLIFGLETTYKLLSSFSLISNTKKLLSTEQRASDIHCLHGMRFISMCWVILGHSFLFPVSFSSQYIMMLQTTDFCIVRAGKYDLVFFSEPTSKRF